MKNIFTRGLIAFLLVIAVTFNSDAQQIAQIGSGNSIPTNTLFSPVYRFSASSSTTAAKSNILFTADEISAAGIVNGSIISAIEFYKTNVANFAIPASKFDVYVANSSNTSLATTTTWASIQSSHTLVYQSTSYNFPDSIGWVRITFNTPFVYNGGGIEIATDLAMTGNGGATGPFQWQYTSGTPTDRIIGITGTGTTLSSTTSSYKNRPNIRFVYSGTPCVSPPTAGTSIASETFVCSGANVNLQVQGNSLGLGQTYVWESSSTETGTYTPISTSNSVPSFTINPTSDNWYRCAITCSGQTVYSTPIQVRVNLGLNGTFTIDKSLATQGTNFNSFTDAVNALKCGITGPVVFNVNPNVGEYNEYVEVPKITGASSTNTITINGNGATLKYLTTTSANRAIVKLVGTEYLIIDSLNIEGERGSSTTKYAWGIHFINNANNNIVRNSTITVSDSTTSTSAYFGIVFSGSSTGYTTTDVYNNNIIENNTIRGGYIGISMYAGSSNTAIGNKILNNKIYNFYSDGINVYGTDSTFIEGNDVYRDVPVLITSTAGIIIRGNIELATVSKNRIHDLSGGVLTNASILTGIEINGADAAVGRENTVVNNLIYSFNNSGTNYGIYNASSNGCNIYNNTIVFNSELPVSSITYGIYQLTLASNINIYNNIIQLTRNSTGNRIALYFATNTSTINSDYNIVRLSDTTSNIYFGSFGSVATAGNAVKSIDAWRLKGDSTFDQNSYADNPFFLNPAANDFTPTSAALDNKGLAIAGVTTDFNGQTRSVTNPDIGAIEFNPPPPDVGVFSFSAPQMPLSPGSSDIIARVINYGGSTLTNFNVNYSINGVPGTPITYNGSLVQRDTAIVNLGSFNFIDGSTYAIKAWAYNPNGTIDPNAFNDTAITNVVACNPLTGNYTVNTAQAVSSTNFHTVSDFINRLKNCGIAGDVVLNVDQNVGVLNERIFISDIPNLNGVNTLTLNGNGVIVTDTILSTEGFTRSLLNINESENITIRGFEFKIDEETQQAYVVNFNKSKNIKFTNNKVTSPTATSSTFGAIVLNNAINSTATTAGANTYITIDSNIIEGSYYGIIVAGTTTNNLQNKQISITNNQITDFGYYGIYMTASDSNIISNNIISRPNATNSNTVYGIYIASSAQDLRIEKNRIHSLFKSALTSTSTSYGIYLSTGATPGLKYNKVLNNLVYGIENQGTNYGLYTSTSGNIFAYGNTIVHDSKLTSTGPSYGIYVSGSAANSEFKNNNIVVTKNSSDLKYGIYVSTAATTIISDYNNVYVPQGNFGYYNGALRATIGDWQTATVNNDLNSYSLNPFSSVVNNGQYIPNNILLDDKGTSLADLTDDINGVTRGVFPDMGAFEFTIVNDDAGITALSNGVICSGNTSLNVQLKNFGAAQLTSAVVNWSVNGVAQTPVNFTGALDNNQQTDIALGPYNFIAGQSYSIKVWSSLPNTLADINNLNDTLTLTGIRTGISGNFTVGTAGNFSTIKNALDSISMWGVCGPVVLNLESNRVFTEQVFLSNIKGLNTLNTLTIKGNNTTLRPVITNTNERAVVKFSNIQYVVLDSLTIEVASNSDYGYAVQFLQNSHNNTVKNSTIITSTTSTSSTAFAGVVFNGSANSILSNNNNAFKNNKIENNTIIGGYYSIVLYGNPNDIELSKSNEFRNNSIRDFYTYGIYVYASDSAIIYGNNLERPNRTSVTTANNIYITNLSKNLRIYNNKISNSFGGNLTSTSAFYGIYFTGSPANGMKESIVANNLIYNLTGNGAQYGLYLTNSDSIQFYHNTLIFNNQVSNTAVINALLQSGTTALPNIIFKNNLISITRPGTGNRIGLYLTAAGSNVQSNNNNFYINANGGNNNVVYANSTFYSNLSAWQVTGQDANSYALNPSFSIPSPGVYLPSSGALDNQGVYIPFVDKDLRDSVRNMVSPDIGAFEFTGIAQDAAIPSIDFRGSCPGLTDIKINLLNASSSTLDDITINWKVNGVSQSTVNLSNLGLQPTQRTSINLGSITIDTLTNYSFEFVASNPNGLADGNNANDTLRINSYVAALSGNYTIGGPSADFPSIKSFADVLNLAGVCGPVVANVNPNFGPYTDRITFAEIFGTSAVNTITLNGSNAVVTDTISTTANRALVFLNGTSYLTIDSLDIQLDDNSTFGYNILLKEAKYNTIKNSKITNLAETSTAFAGIVFSGAENTISSNSNSAFNTIENNIINGGYYGISLYGTSGNRTASKENIIRNNRVEDFYAYGIYVQNADSIFVVGNDLSRKNRTVATTTYGIRVSSSSQNVWVENNKIHNLYDAMPTENSTTYGIYHATGAAVAGSSNIVVNNLIYDITNEGSTYGIYNSGSGNVKYYHNTVVFAGNNSAGLGYSVYQTTSATGIELFNNIFYNDKKGTGKKVGIYMNTATTPLVSDYNNIYVPGGHIGFNVNDKTTLSAWRAVATNDTNSISVDPIFSFANNGNYSPTISIANNKGTNLGVTNDITGKVRSTTTPDMGAYEFDPISNDIAVVEILYPTSIMCGLPNDSIVVAIRNQGANNQTGFNIKANITGAASASLNYLYAGTIASGQIDTIVISNYNSNVSGNASLTVYSELAIDEYRLNDTLRKTINLTPAASAPTASDVTVCKGEQAILVAQTNLPLVNWYNDQGQLLVSNDTLITPKITGNTKFYVEASNQALTQNSVGPVSTAIGGGGGTNLHTYQQLFTVNTNVTIDTVYVYASANGTVVVNIKNNSNAIVHTVSVPVTTTGLTQKIAIPINKALTPGNYKMDAVGTSMNLYRNTAGAIYPYSTSGNELVITGSSFSNVNYYYFFYDWKVTYLSQGCPSPRVEVNVNTLPSLTNSSLKKSSTSTGVHNSGSELNPDVVCADGSLDYYVQNPNGYDSLSHGTTWKVDSVKIYNLNSGNLVSSGVTINNQFISVDAVASQIDSTYKIVLLVQDLTNTLCDTTIEHYFKVVSPDVISLGNDTSICDGASLNLAVSNTGTSYLWSTGATTSSITVNTAGTYSLIFTNAGGCVSYDTITVSILGAPSKVLGNDTSICANSSLILDAGNPGATYLWSNGETTQTITVSAAGFYSVEISNAQGCVTRDTILVGVNANPIVNFGPDQTVCSNESVVLDAGNVGSTYLWSTGETTQTINALSAGTYSVVVTNASGCTATDTILVRHNQVPDASFTSSQLSNLSVQFNSVVVPGTSYSWNFGDPTSPSNTSLQPNPIHVFTAPGTYTVTLTVTNVSTGCVNTDTNFVSVFVGIDAKNVDLFNFYAAPNPYAGSTNINFTLIEDSKVYAELYDVLGRKIMDVLPISDLNSGTHTIALNNGQDLSSGIYLVKLNVNGVESVIRIQNNSR